MNKDSKIYIAGHKGLVGSAIFKLLKNRGYKNLIGMTHSELDLLDYNAVSSFFIKEKPEYVFLAAAHVGGIAANNKYRADFIYNNLQIQNNVIFNSYLNNVTKLLFLGSTCIYPKYSSFPIKEEYLLNSQLEYTNEPYAIAKIAGIKLCESLNIQYNTNFISVMPTNLYGPNDNFDFDKSHVLPAMIRKIYLGKCLMEENFTDIKKNLYKNSKDNFESKEKIISYLENYGIYNDKIILWGTGKPLREFLWSEDMADASIFVMENIDFESLAKNKKEITNTQINIGTGQEISIQKLSQLIKETVEYKGEIIFDNSKPDGTLRKVVDTTKLESLGWKYKMEIENGVRELYNWYIKN